MSKPISVARGGFYGFAAGLAIDILLVGSMAFYSSTHVSVSNNEVKCNMRDVTQNAGKAAIDFWPFLANLPLLGALGGKILVREQNKATPVG